MRLATASGRRSQQLPDQTSAYRCGRSRLRRLGQPYQPSPRPSPLCAHPRRSRCLILRSNPDVRSERGSGCSSRFQTPSGRRIVALSGASVGLVEGVLGAANVRNRDRAARGGSGPYARLTRTSTVGSTISEWCRHTPSPLREKTRRGLHEKMQKPVLVRPRWTSRPARRHAPHFAMKIHLRPRKSPAQPNSGSSVAPIDARSGNRSNGAHLTRRRGPHVFNPRPNS